MKSRIIIVYKDIEGNISEEKIWAELLENGYYRIDNIPFYAPNLAYRDVISVENDQGVLYFDDLIKASGHSTVQIIFFKEWRSAKVLEELEKLGCKWEGMKDAPYFSVDVPPSVIYNVVKSLLDKELENEMLDYKEACLAEGHQ
jgi:hypothetical protein